MQKTKVMHIRSPNAKFQINPNIIYHNLNCLHKNIPNNCICESLELVTEYVYLGITVDCFFKWDKHIKKPVKDSDQLLAECTH